MEYSGRTVSRAPGPSACALNLGRDLGLFFCCFLLYFLVGVYGSEQFPPVRQDFSVILGEWRLYFSVMVHGTTVKLWLT